MRNALYTMIATTLLAGAVFAQQKPQNLSDILNKMDAHQETLDTRTPARTQPAEKVDVEAALKKSREYYVAGEFEAAQRGFEMIVRIEPENAAALRYLGQLLERDARQVKTTGMEEVQAGWNTRLVLRSYALSADAVKSMGLEDTGNAVAVERHFPEVQFPEGATAAYHPATRKIFVQNTRENLAVLEEILLALDVAKLSDNVEQVEIEVKFVEVTQGTLEELGFEWRSFDGRDISVFDNWSYDGSYFLFDDALRGGPSGPDMPFIRPSDLGSGRDAGNTSRFEDTFNKDPSSVELQHRGGTELDLLITALDQSTGADVLSAPRVVTKSGQSATIRVGELHNYPEVYEVDVTQATLPNISYEEFEEKLLGVELAVTPEVNGDQIELDLNPRITELAGWRTYQVAPSDSIYNHRQDKLNGVYGHPALTARLPIFKKREINTTVTIADGSTIGMGGLISEKMESFEDRVPVLGRIPLLGRLFRNEGERVIKRNLVMFVTAKNVQATGRVNTERSFE